MRRDRQRLIEKIKTETFVFDTYKDSDSDGVSEIVYGCTPYLDAPKVSVAMVSTYTTSRSELKISTILYFPIQDSEPTFFDCIFFEQFYFEGSLSSYTLADFVLLNNINNIQVSFTSYQATASSSSQSQDQSAARSAVNLLLGRFNTWTKTNYDHTLSEYNVFPNLLL